MCGLIYLMGETYSEVEGDLHALLLDVGVEACLLVRRELVREGGRGYKWRDAG